MSLRKWQLPILHGRVLPRREASERRFGLLVAIASLNVTLAASEGQVQGMPCLYKS
ncbi:MAG: hypothetical protein AAGA60_28170 [Cyanobacteria bacterium P01_E01_bin.42]